MRGLQGFLALLLVATLLAGAPGCRGGADDAGEPSPSVTPATDSAAPTESAHLAVQSVSPAPLASGVARNAAITIQLDSVLWPSLLASQDGGETVAEWQSSELEDRFRVVNSTTGEMVRGTVRVRDGTRLTFALLPGSTWALDTAYYVALTSADSFEETYYGGSPECLFTTVFSTAGQDRDNAPVAHPTSGAAPQVLTGVAYDVDTSSSLSFTGLANAVSDAPGLARDAGASAESSCTAFLSFRQSDCVRDPETGKVRCSRDEGDKYRTDIGRCCDAPVTEFHFWPNIINLTEVYYAQSSHMLFDHILDLLLANEPGAEALRRDIAAQVKRGDRVFSACDFVSDVFYEFTSYHEVYYGLIINLDGGQAPYVREILVHDGAEDGLPLLHDPHVGQLAHIFEEPGSVEAGESWILCLRGNLKTDKYNALVVDRLDDDSEAEFHIGRVLLTCGGCGGGCGTWDTSRPGFLPWKPWNPLMMDEEFDFMPNPNPPGNPHAPFGPAAGPSGPYIHPWPFPAGPDTFLPPEDTVGLPGGETGAEAEGNEAEGICEAPEMCCEDTSGAERALEDAADALEDLEEQRRQDREEYEVLDYGWPDDPEGMEFNDPCLQKLLEDYLEQLAPLREEMQDLRDSLEDLSDRKQELKEGMDPVLQALYYRGNIWANVLYIGGDWSRVRTQCPGPFIPAGGYTFEASKVEDVLIAVTEETQRKWQASLGNAVMQGMSWKQAAAAMVANPKNYPEGYVAHDTVFQVIMNWYADCMKRSYTQSLNIYLRGEFGEGLTDAQLQQMIQVMFNGASALTPAQRAEYERFEEEDAELDRQMADIVTAMGKLADRMEQLRQDFRRLANRCCFAASREKWERLLQQKWILQSYLDWCASADKSRYDVGYRDGNRLCSVPCEMRDAPPVAGDPVFVAYLDWLFACICPEFDCTDSGAPDPVCAEYLD
ncbi:MAG: hypothetical protein IMY84_03255 [Chloroflexi bacterium]|nr:hypothetical protein [Chloroflexota bacterium]